MSFLNSEHTCLAWKLDSAGWGMTRRGCDPLQALTPHSNPLGAQGEGRSSSAPGRAVLSLEGGLGHRDVAGVPGMGPG